MTETNHLAPSASEATAAAERLAAWVIGALTAIVIGGGRPRHRRAARWARGWVVLASRDQRLAQRHGGNPPQHRVRAHPTPPHRRPPSVHDRGLRRVLPLPHHLPDPPRPRGLGPLPRCGVAAPRLLRASHPP